MRKLILAYHGVENYENGEEQWIEYCSQRYKIKELSVPVFLFEKQLRYLRESGYQNIALRDFLNSEQKKLEGIKKAVAITFDDGFKNFFTFARPLLLKYGYRATIFLIGDKIGAEYFLSRDEIFHLHKEGFSFGCHTLSHPVLTELPIEKARMEISQSKKMIEEELARPLDFFCYPYGKYNEAVQGLVREAGFAGAVVTPHGPGIAQGRYSLKRTGINRGNSMLVFKFKVSGGFDLLREHKLLWTVLKKF